MRPFLLVVGLCVACAHSTAPEFFPEYAPLVGATDRTAEDRALDPGRKPEGFLGFIGARPGMQVGELFAGGGYTTELLARSVGPTGTVYGQNSPEILEKFAEKPWSSRLLRPINTNVRRIDRPFDTPFPETLDGVLDMVVSNANYHDVVWMKVYRLRMNQAVYRSLKPGGAYVVCDSSAQEGAGVTVVESLHRIEEKVVVDEITAAGFTLAATGDFLRNPKDPRDWNVSPRVVGANRGTGDRFCLRFVRP